MRPGTSTTLIAAAGILLTATQAHAANAQFQSFFFDVCTTPTGTLAARCAETTGALGNLSGDSESSLNPSQNLGYNQPGVGVALARSKQARERGERLRDDEPAEESGAKMSVGPFSLLVNLNGTAINRKSDGAIEPERGFEGDSLSGELGFDYRVSDKAVIGVIAGIESTRIDFDPEAAGVNFTPASHAGRADSDNLYLTLFGSWSLGEKGYLELSGGYEKSDGSYQRNSVFQESTRTVAQTNVRVKGDADGTVTWASINGGLNFDHGSWSFGPFAGVTATRAKLDAYSEDDLSGSGLNMSFSSSTRKSLLGHAGVRAGIVRSIAAGVLIPQFRVEYQHEFENDPQTVNASFALDASGNQYLMTGASGDKDSINAGLSLALVLPNGWMPFFDFSILLENKGLDRQRGTLGLRVEF